MLDIGLSKMALIGVVALVVIGPERLPTVARTLGSLIGRAQRYAADVKAEVNRTMEMDELRKMKESVEEAARDIQTSAAQLDKDLNAAAAEAEELMRFDESRSSLPSSSSSYSSSIPSAPIYEYEHPGKKLRLRRSAVPRWYKVRSGVRTNVQSGAARVARFRPKR